MTNVTAVATIITTVIQTSITGTSSGQTVVLNPISGGETEDFRTFKEQIRRSVILAQVPNNAKLDYLKLVLTGGALAFFLKIPTAERDTFDKAIQAPENRYISANRIELFMLKNQERKFNISRETPDYYLTDLTRLANLAIPNLTGGDRSQERTRQIRYVFISGMLSQLRLKLLMEPDTKPVQELCTFVSKSLALKSILADEEATSTAFNALSFNDTTTSMTEALNSTAATNREWIKTQRELGNNVQRFWRGINQRRSYMGFMLSRGNPNINKCCELNSFASRPHQNRGSWTNCGQPSQRFQNSFRGRGFATAVDNQDTKEVTAGLDRYQNMGKTSHSTDMTLSKTQKKTTLSNDSCRSM